MRYLVACVIVATVAVPAQAHRPRVVAISGVATRGVPRTVLTGATPLPAMRRWLHRSALPTPTRVAVHWRSGDTSEGDDAVMAAWPGRIEVYRPRVVDAAAFMHEVGHLFDFEFLSDVDRLAFEWQVFGQDGPWLEPADGTFGVSPIEEFAEVYSVLARHPHVWDWRGFDNEGDYLNDVSHAGVVAARRIIRHAATRGHAEWARATFG